MKSSAGNNPGVNTLAAVDTPRISEMSIELEKLIQQGILTPEEAQIYLQQGSQLQDYQEDPTLRNSQLKALSDLQETVDGDGMDAQAKARIASVLAETQSAERGSREAIMANQRARGLGGSGMELAAQLSNQQSSAGRANSEALQTASIAEQRKMEALSQMSNLGGQMRNQDFSQAESIAKAQDAINNFNTQNKQNVHNYNIQNKNQAQAANLAARQNISNQNSAITNQQEIFNKNLVQQDFDNRYKKAGGTAAAQQNEWQTQIQQDNAKADEQRQMIGTIFSAAAMSDERAKENIEPLDSSQFLDSITGYKYTYKKPKEHGEGEQMGVMAQDLEKTPAGKQAVKEDSEGMKRVDYSKLGGPILAALADINERLKKVE